MRFTVPLLLGLLAAAPAAQAQTGMPESYREVQLRMLKNQRELLLKMADSMPERLYRDAASAGQRDFAQQMEHAAGSAAGIAGMTMGGPAPTLPDTAAALASREGLRGYINAAYDYAERVLREQPAAAREEPVELFGQQMPRWQVWDEIHHHTMWTAGQIVANFRKHGMAPPSFALF